MHLDIGELSDSLIRTTLLLSVGLYIAVLQVDEISLLLGVTTHSGASEKQVLNLMEVIHAELNCIQNDMHWNHYRLEVGC